MYQRIQSNVRKTWLLIFVFVLITVAMGFVFGYMTDTGPIGPGIAVLVAVGMSWGSYFNSDKIALRVSHAVEADPVRYKQLHNLVEGMTIASGLPKPRVYVVEDEAPNAFATGRDPEHAAIAVTTGLLQKMDRDELEGVIAHEMSHIQNRDILVMTIAVTLVGVIVLLADWLLRAMFWGGMSRNRDSNSNVGGIVAIFGLVLMIVAPLIAQLMHFAVSRRREFLADADAVNFTRNPAGLISALQKLKGDQTVVRYASRATAHMWIEEPNALKAQDGGPGVKTRKSGAWLNRMFATHPPLDERIEALESMTFGYSSGEETTPAPPPPPTQV
ncbi:MAG TPA: M48 family metallopeptidase [Actinomycetota bacterium]|nr:M48 family metallopeptidase [Actinomycetota bacterium]